MISQMAIPLQSAVAQGAPVRVIAHTGGVPPGVGGGAQFFGMSEPQLNSVGKIAFFASMTGDSINSDNNVGLWSDRSANLQLISRIGDQSPGTSSGVHYAEFDLASLRLNSAGKLAFHAELAGEGVTSQNNVGVWSGDATSFALVARSGDVATEDPLLRAFVDFGRIAFNAAGDVAVRGILSDLTTGIWAENSGNLRLVALAGDQAPGLGAGVEFSHLNSPKMNDAGQLAFTASVAGPGISPSRARSLWMTAAGTPQMVARQGDVAPGVDFGVRFAGGTLSAFAPFSISNSGHIAFQANLEGASVNDSNDVGIWSNASGLLELKARTGDQVPGDLPGVVFNSFAVDSANPVAESQKSFSQNEDGRIAFWATLAGNGIDQSNDVSIWSERSGSLELIARRGDQAPGLPDGVSFQSFSPNVHLNGEGATAFVATVVGDGVDFTNNRGIWVQDVTGDTQLVVRKGDPIEFSPGDSRDITDFPFTDAFEFNDLGQIAVRPLLEGPASAVLLFGTPAEMVGGDFNNDGLVNGRDLLNWQRTDAVSAALTAWQGTYGFPFEGDFDGDGDVDANDLTDPLLGWQSRYGVDLDGSSFLSWQRQIRGDTDTIPTVIPVPESSMAVALFTASRLAQMCFRKRRH